METYHNYSHTEQAEKNSYAIQISVLSSFCVVVFSTIVSGLFAWSILGKIYLKVWRTLNALDEKLVLAEKLMQRRKFSEDIIGQLSLAANFDLKGMEEEKSKMLTQMPAP